MWTPPRPVHLHAALGQTARERIVLVLGAVGKIVGQPEGCHGQHCIDPDAPPFLARSIFYPQVFFLLFSSLLRHGFLISRLFRGRLFRERLFGARFFKPPPGAPQAAHRSCGTPASTPRRPPSHPPARRVENRRVERPAAPPADAE